MRNKDKEEKSDTTLSASELATAFDLSKRRIQQLAKEGIMVREKRGQYNAIESIRNYLRFIKEKDSEQEADYFLERALHEKVKREKAEIELAAMRGHMHHSEDVAAVMNDMITSIRAKLLSLPTKLAPRLLNQENLSLIRDEIQREMHEALDELSNYDRKIFLSHSDDYIEVNEDDNDDSE